MKKTFIIICITLFTFQIAPINIKLKEKVYIDNNELWFSQIIMPEQPFPYEDFIIETTGPLPLSISGKEIINSLFNRNIYNISIIGDETLVYSSKKVPETKNTPGQNYVNTITLHDPVNFLKQYLLSYLDQENFQLEIDVLNVEPHLDLNLVEDEYQWEIKKLKRGLKDLENLSRVPLIINQKKYLVNLDLKLFSHIYISRESCLEGDFFASGKFVKKYVDVLSFQNFDSLVYDINHAAYSRFKKKMGSGEVLRWNNLEKIPVVKKGEDIRYVFSKNNFSIQINSTSLEEGTLNEKIKVELKNGKKKFGIIKNNRGTFYVQAY